MADPRFQHLHPADAASAVPKAIYLMRHGVSTWNEVQRTSGQLDPPLAERGMELAKRLGRVMRDVPLTAIHCSSLARSHETARPTAFQHGLPIHQHAALREQHLGILQGRYRDHRDPAAQQLWAQRSADRVNFVPPGGETYAALETRVVACLRRILNDEAGGVILIVGHRITNRVLMRTLLDWTASEAAQIAFRSKFLYEVIPGDAPRVNTILLSENKAGSRCEGFRT